MEGSIFSARLESIEYIKFVGVIRYTQCTGLETYIEELFDSPSFTDIVIDLDEADMLDSTALGLLARISIEYKKISDTKPVVFLENGELAHILKRVCFDQVFNIVAQSKNKNDVSFVELVSISKNEEEVLDYVLDAHKYLAKISDKNQHYFTDISQAIGKTK